MKTSLKKCCLLSLPILFFPLCFLGQGWGQSKLQESDPAYIMEDAALKKLIPADSVITLTIRDAVMQALENNLDIQVSRFTRDVRLTDIVFQEAEFDPTIELGGRYDRRIIPLNRPIFGLGGVAVGNDPDTFDQNDTRFNLGLTQKLITGGNYGLRFDTNRNSVAGPNTFLFNPSYSSNLLANLTQPLLRNFGPTINQTQVTIAKNSAAVEELSLTQQILSIISQVEQEYWELVFTRENLKVTKSTLRAAEELLASNRAKVKAGVLADVEALQAQAGVASRIEQVLLAQKAVQDQEDKLRQLLSESEWNLTQTIPLVPLDSPIKELQPTPLEENITFAFQHRPEVLQAKKNIDTSQINTRFAKNQLLPDLSLQGEFGLAGLGNNTGRQLGSVGQYRFLQHGRRVSAHLSFRQPFCQKPISTSSAGNPPESSLVIAHSPTSYTGRQRSDSRGADELQTNSDESSLPQTF